MKTLSIRDAKNRLTEIAREVEAGETIVVTRNGRPIFDLVPHERRGGIDLAAGAAYLASRGIGDVVVVVSQDFDEPLDDDFLLRDLPLEP